MLQTEGRIVMDITIRISPINITTSDTTIWNVIKNLFVPVWYADGTVDVQLIPITAIIVLLTIL
jgi:hypothetical protein